MHKITRNAILGLVIVTTGTGALIAQPASSPPQVPGAAITSAAPAAVSTTAPPPKIRFATPVYDFGKVKCGLMVKYSYVFTNIGGQTLEISAVQPGCGCTTAGEWTRKVEPGQTGSVAIQFNSLNFNGPVLKTVSIRCNDPAVPQTVLQLRGTVWRPIDFVPQNAVMNLPPDLPNASTVVKVINNTEEKVTLSPPEVNNRSFVASLSTNVPGKEYQITVSTVPPLPPGNIQAQITVRTSSTNTPVLTIPLWVNVQPAVVVMPPQVALPPAPLQARTAPSITIQNNSTNALVLSDAIVNAPGVEVQVNTLQTGKVYSVTLAFPQGFELPHGRLTEFSVRSSSSQMPLIKVPVTQAPRPVPAAPSPQAAAH
jgi:hypothetical protein